MGNTGASVYRKSHFFQSNKMRRVLSGFTNTAVVIFETNHGDVPLISLPTEIQESAFQRHPVVPSLDPGKLKNFTLGTLNGEDIAALNVAAGIGEISTEDLVWVSFTGSYQNGASDQIALLLKRDQEITFIQKFLENLWSVLREDCLTESRDMQMTFGDDALLWMISDRIDVAVLVLDARGRMLRVNLAAKEILDTGNILRRGKGGVFAQNEEESKKFRSAVASCALADDPGEGETILFLESGQHGIRVPVSLSRFYYLGKPSDLVVAMLPMPPDPARVEMMGREMGLSSSEARVAALMQSGLTNREAACQAGLKEQTFNTYAKRVLSKLNVNGRTEMAQLLTWQAAGRRIA